MAGPWESEKQDLIPPSPLLAAVGGMFCADNHRRGGMIMDSHFSQQEVALSPFSNKNQGVSSSPNAWPRPMALSANDNGPATMERNKNFPIRASLSSTESLSKKQRIEPCSPALTTTSPPWFLAAHHGMSPLAPLDSVRHARSIALRRLFWEKEIFEQQMRLKMILEHSTGVVPGNHQAAMLENMDSTRRSTLPISVLEQQQRTRNVLHSSLRSPASWLHQQDSPIPEPPMNDIMDYSSASSSPFTKHTTAMAAAGPRQPASLDAPPTAMAAFMPSYVPQQEGWLSGAHSGSGRGSCRPSRPPPVAVLGDQHRSELPSSETIITTTAATAPSSSLVSSEAKPSPETTTSSTSTITTAAPYTINCSESDAKDIIQAILTTSASTDKERNKGAAMIVEKWLGR